MTKFNVLLLGIAVAGAAAAQSTSNDLATGNMHFDAKEMTTNADHMISKDDFMTYAGKMWTMVSKGSDNVPVHDAAQAFARGNMRASTKAMDADHDGTISKDEFMTYEGKQFDKHKDSGGMMSVTDATRYFARGNMH